MRVIKNDRVIYSFKPEMDSIERIQAGEVIKVKSNDCFFGQINDEDYRLSDIDHSRLNPATGPIYVEGAKKGDLLKVKVLDIDLASQGVAVVVPGEGVLGEKVSSSITKIIPIQDGYGVLDNIKIPVKPMIGVIGVAPGEEDGEWPTDSPWKHGGNMDTSDITKGSTLYFPVKQEGALLALGDCHAVMGDGEVCFTGCEIAADVILQVDVVKGREITWPLVETDDSTMVIASGNTIDDAIKEATNQAVDHLCKGLDLSFEEAYMLASLAVDLKISQVVDPKKTVRAAIPKSLLPTERLINSSL